MYAPLYLASEHVISAIKPDYNPTNTVLDVYIDVVRFGLKQAGKSLDFLGFASWTSKPRRPFPPTGDLLRFHPGFLTGLNLHIMFPSRKYCILKIPVKGELFHPMTGAGFPATMSNKSEVSMLQVTLHLRLQSTGQIYVLKAFFVVISRKSCLLRDPSPLPHLSRKFEDGNLLAGENIPLVKPSPKH